MSYVSTGTTRYDVVCTVSNIKYRCRTYLVSNIDVVRIWYQVSNIDVVRIDTFFLIHRNRIVHIELDSDFAVIA